MPDGSAPLTPEELRKLEPCLSANGRAAKLQERSLDPRALAQASFHAARHHNVDVASGPQVNEIRHESEGRSIHTTHSHYSTAIVLTCCGAWAGHIRVQCADA